MHAKYNHSVPWFLISFKVKCNPYIRGFHNLVPSHPPRLSSPASSTCPPQLSEHAGTLTSLNMFCSLAYDILVVSNTLFLCWENSSLGLKVQLKEAPSPCNLLLLFSWKNQPLLPLCPSTFCSGKNLLHCLMSNHLFPISWKFLRTGADAT